MSIKLQLKEAHFNRPVEDHVKLQYIPAGVEENTTANVENFFNNYTTEVNGVMKNSLRGFPLDGCKLSVPDNYRGIVFQETQKPMLDENASRTFKVNELFSSFTYWNYDKEPSNNDKLRQALVWNDFANVLHSPVTPEQFDKENTSSMDVVTEKE